MRDASALASVFKRGAKASNAPRVNESTAEMTARNRRVDDALTALVNAWTRARGARESHVACAVWRRERGWAEVTRARGRGTSRCGRARGGTTTLCALECAFLVETERLALFFDEREETCASVRAVHALMVREGTRWEEYLAYAHLRRAGYACLRFGETWTADARDDGVVGRGGWAGGGGRGASAVEGGGMDERAGGTKRARRAATATRTRQRHLASRRWWLDAGDEGHDWIGPEIDAAVRARTGTELMVYDDAPANVSLTFQVYQPNKNFSKKSPDPVSFYVYVCSDRPPTGKEARALLDQAQGKPVRIASCRQSTVMMFTLDAA